MATEPVITTTEQFDPVTGYYLIAQRNEKEGCRYIELLHLNNISRYSEHVNFKTGKYGISIWRPRNWFESCVYAFWAVIKYLVPDDNTRHVLYFSASNIVYMIFLGFICFVLNSFGWELQYGEFISSFLLNTGGIIILCAIVGQFFWCIAFPYLRFHYLEQYVRFLRWTAQYFIF